MIPVVALIGRPNVGKSTLFNRLTCTRDALVIDCPELTRDRQYGFAKWEGHQFIVIDTGGINDVKEGIKNHVLKQSLIAIKEADIVLFMVDGQAGVVANDQDIAKYLRKLQKIVFIVANKINKNNINSMVNDFYALGIKNIVSIDALHGWGVNSLLKESLSFTIKIDPLLNIKNKLKSRINYKNEILLKEKCSYGLEPLPIKIAIVGRPNVGKSTLTNCILNEERVIVYETPGTTRDSIYIPMTRKNQNYILVDTAGVRKRIKVTDSVEKFSIIKTMQAIEYANVVLFLIDVNLGISDQDLSILSFIIKSGRSLVITFNKCDNLSNLIRDNIKQTLNQRLKFINFAQINFISALYKKGIDLLFKSINKTYECATKRVSTALLTRIMHAAIKTHLPPLIRGKRAKIKYVHAGGYNPPILVFHGSRVKNLSDSYKRYLVNYFRRSLNIIGTPIFIRFNETSNHFKNKHNIPILMKLRKNK